MVERCMSDAPVNFYNKTGVNSYDIVIPTSLMSTSVSLVRTAPSNSMKEHIPILSSRPKIRRIVSRDEKIIKINYKSAQLRKLEDKESIKERNENVGKLVSKAESMNDNLTSSWMSIVSSPTQAERITSVNGYIHKVSCINSKECSDDNVVPTEPITNDTQLPDDSPVDFVNYDIKMPSSTDNSNDQHNLHTELPHVIYAEDIDSRWPQEVQWSMIRNERMSNPRIEHRLEKCDYCDGTIDHNIEQSSREREEIAVSEIQYQYLSCRWGNQSSGETGVGMIKKKTGVVVYIKRGQKKNYKVELFGCRPSIYLAKDIISKIKKENIPVSEREARVLIEQGGKNLKMISGSTGAVISIVEVKGHKSVEVIGVPYDITTARSMLYNIPQFKHRISKFHSNDALKTKDSKVIVYFTASDDEAGRIYGTKSCNINNINDSCDVCVDVLGSKGDALRVFAIRGTNVGISKALEMIGNKLNRQIDNTIIEDDNSETPLKKKQVVKPSGKLTVLQVPVTDGQAGYIIGNRGMTIKKIRMETGVEVGLKGKRGTDDRKIEIIGSRNQINSAVELITTIFGGSLSVNHF